MVQKVGNSWLFAAKTVLFLFVLGGFFVGQIIFYEQTLFFYWGNYVVLLLYATNIFLTSKIYHGFGFGSVDLKEIILSWIICLLVANSLQYLILSLSVMKLLPVAGFLAIIGAQYVLVIPTAVLIDKAYYRVNPAHKAIIIYGKEKKASEYLEIIEKHREKFKIKQVVSQEEPAEALLSYIKDSESVFFLDVAEKKRERLLEYCFLHNKRTYILPTFSGVLLNTAGISWISHTPMFLPKSPKLDIGTRFIKRSMDIAISLLAIILFSWLMILTWAAVFLYDRRSAIYRQTRITKDGKQFTLYKFRSMNPDAEDDGVPRLTAKDDDRITPVGRFIRRTRIDEFPQLFNVLTGKMSIVGPRPERPEIAKQYEERYPNFAFRTKVKAGITGLAQIYGKYNTAPDEKLFLDVMYIEKLSIWQDVILMLQTLKVIFSFTSTEGVPKDSTTAMR